MVMHKIVNAVFRKAAIVRTRRDFRMKSISVFPRQC